MGVGGNYVLDKGFLATGATAYAQGEIALLGVGTGAQVNNANTITRATGASALTQLVVVMENLDAIRLATGKAIIDCRVLGIARTQTGAAVAALARVTNDGTARAVAVTRAIAGAQPQPILGIALTASTAAGQQIDVLLTPGATY